MSTMTTDETYNGYKNRETWAFNLHWQNDQGLYNETLDVARAWLAERELSADTIETEVSTRMLGEHVVSHWRDMIRNYRDYFGSILADDDALAMMRDEVGSWWRIDYAEVGAAVRESLGVESGDTAGHDSSVSLDPERDTDNES